MYKRGFTLIELLVVIAIIGILSSVVLVSLNSARSRGGDAAIKANLSSIRTQAELFADVNGYKYSTDTTALASAQCPVAGNTMFNADAVVRNAIAAAYNAGNGIANTRCAAGPGAATYAVSVQLKASTNWWCADSTGNAKQITGPGAPNLGGGAALAACP